jgi:hypothetical protein
MLPPRKPKMQTPYYFSSQQKLITDKDNRVPEKEKKDFKE